VRYRETLYRTFSKCFYKTQVNMTTKLKNVYNMVPYVFQSAVMVLLALRYVSLARRVRTTNLDGTVTVTQPITRGTNGNIISQI